MANFFRKTNDDKEVAAGSKEPPPTPPAKPASGPVDFTRPLPRDPEKEAARAAAKLRLLRKQDEL